MYKLFIPALLCICFFFLKRFFLGFFYSGSYCINLLYRNTNVRKWKLCMTTGIRVQWLMASSLFPILFLLILYIIYTYGSIIYTYYILQYIDYRAQSINMNYSFLLCSYKLYTYRLWNVYLLGSFFKIIHEERIKC